MEFRKLFFAHFLGALMTVLLGLGGFLGYQWHQKHYLADRFSVSTEQIAKDMEGRQVSISHGQVWPFDKNQGLTVSVVSKKQAENFVILVVDVRATAIVDQPKVDAKDKEKAPAPKVPTKVNVSGYLRLTYEPFGNEWFLVGVDALTAKAAAQFD